MVKKKRLVSWEKPVKKHRHRWTIAAWGPGQRCELRCNDEECGARRERDQTKFEAKRFADSQKKNDRNTKTMHRVYWEFMKKFQKEPDSKSKTPWLHRWRYTGYDLMTRLEKWAKRHPKDVIVMSCDDSVHASSNVFFILHRNRRRLWGTTVIVVTQCDGIPPKEFFLYPGHAHEMALALRTLEKHVPMDRELYPEWSQWKKKWR